MFPNIKFAINSSTFLKDPESSELGKKIVSGSIDMIAEIGIEEFNFKKLAQKIGTTEASIYRYFENKNKLLLYLNNWYWNWLFLRLQFATNNIEDPKQRLEKVVNVLTNEHKVNDQEFDHINEPNLYKIIVQDSSKAYFNSTVDEENKEGVFSSYKEIVQWISDIVLEVKSDYPYSHMLVSTIIEGIHQQQYFAEHLPSLTDTSQKNSIEDFYNSVILSVLQ